MGACFWSLQICVCDNMLLATCDYRCRYLRQLEAIMLVVDKDVSLTVTGADQSYFDGIQ